MAPTMADTPFRFVAARFSTHRMRGSKALATLWRVLFYLLRPRQPFVMRTRDYRLLAHPCKGGLTRAVIRRGYWEALETEIFCGLLRPGGLVIDVGANFGHYALIAANAIGPEGLVVAFEPDPETFALLDANRKLLPKTISSRSKPVWAPPTAPWRFTPIQPIQAGTVFSIGTCARLTVRRVGRRFGRWIHSFPNAFPTGPSTSLRLMSRVSRWRRYGAP